MTAAELKKYYISKEFTDNYIYEGKDLGVTYSKDGSVFKVWAPTATEVSVNIYTKGSEEEGGELEGTYSLTKGEKGVFVYDAKELGDLKNKFYTYNVTVDGVTKETWDVYAKACGVNSYRSMIVDLAETNPEGFENDKRLKINKSDAVIYELHIKDFSYDVCSGVKDEYRGKFKAFTQDDTWLCADKETGFPTCVNYLKDLGVTYVHLLPSYDYGSIDETKNDESFNWGYDPMNYNVPEGSYSTNPYDGRVRIREYKEMVQALHKAGIGVVMDVVYNHTYNTDSAFQNTVPYYYYRLNEDGSWSNG
jgi:pullulanase